jgi:O-succinylbenzoic acid--CoA ligase
MKINSIDIKAFNFTNNEELGTLIEEWNSYALTMIAKSSGSTGEPKTIEIYKKHMQNSAELTARYFNIAAHSNVLLALPLTFIAGKMMVIRSIVNDWNLILTDCSSNPSLPESALQFAAFTPMQAEHLLETQFDKFNQIETVILGGGAISNSLFQKLKKCRNRIFATYGMTESITHVAACELKMQDESQVFEALPGVEFHQDERGCLCIKAAHLDDSVFITNDLVEMKDSKHFRYLGRLDNVINSAGLKIFPEKIEAEIEEIIGAPFYVTSIEDDVLGQKMVVMIEGNENNFSDVLKKLDHHFLHRNDRPRAYFFREKFKFTHTGKVIKKYFE